MDRSLGTLDWSLVQAFLAVAEEGSLSGAARRLGLSQPTLGRQVRALEEQLAADVFVRKSKGLALSETGRAMLEAAQTMREGAARMQMVADGRDDQMAGTVRITASVATAFWHLPPIVAKLRSEAPDIQIEVVPSDESRNLLFREADIAIRMFRPTQLDLIARHIGDIRLGAYASRDYLKTAPPITSDASLIEQLWVGYDEQTQIVDGMRAAGFPIDRSFFSVRCDQNATYWALVQAGCGIGFGQAPIAALDPNMVEIPLGTDIPPLPLWLAVPEALRHKPRVARVWDALVEGLTPLVS